MLECRVKRQLRDFELDVSLSALNGEITVLKGDNGSGKTTILRMIAGLLDPDEGYIRIGDMVVCDVASQKEIPIQKRKIGYILQNPMVFPHMTVKKNVEYGLHSLSHGQDEKEVDVKKWLNILNISHMADLPARDLSGGEKQRVALARAFVTRPVLLLMDEPFTGLDRETREVVKVCISRYVQEWKIPCLLVSHHDTEISGIARKILEIERGRITEGNPE